MPVSSYWGFLLEKNMKISAELKYIDGNTSTICIDGKTIHEDYVFERLPLRYVRKKEVDIQTILNLKEGGFTQPEILEMYLEGMI